MEKEGMAGPTKGRMEKKKKKTNEKREWTNALFLVSYVFEIHHKNSQI